MKIKVPPGISHGRRAMTLAAASAPLAAMLTKTEIAVASTDTPGITAGASAATTASNGADPGHVASSLTPSEFISLSETLTVRKSLDPIIADRAWKDLTAEDQAFPLHAAMLARLIANESFSDMRQFQNFVSKHPEAKSTAMKIISAWYLGYTGTPAMHSAVDDARFVAYAGALMYEPTADATVVPSYSRGHTNYWSEPPASIKND